MNRYFFRRLLLLYFSTYCIFINYSIAYSLSDTPDLPINKNDISSVTANPIEGSKNYRLDIFSDIEEKKRIFTVVRPLIGNVVDVKIDDIDKDAEDELVVIMKEESSLSQKEYYDVFEFTKPKLPWIKRLLHILGL